MVHWQNTLGSKGAIITYCETNMRSLAFGILLVFSFMAYGQDPANDTPSSPRKEGVATSTAADRVSDVSVNKWDDIQVVSLQKLLQESLRDPNFGPGKILVAALKVPSPQVTVRKNYPPEENVDGVPEPYLSISFDATEDAIANPAVEQAANEFVSNVLSQNYFSQEFLQNLPADMKTSSNWIKPEYLKVWVGPEDTSGNPFQTPRGLSMPWRALAYRLGYLPRPNSTMSIAFTQAICREMAIKAIREGMYEDAIVLANHGQTRSRNADATLLYIRAYCEITLGKGAAATETIREMKAVRSYPTDLQERLNGPPAVYLRQARLAIR